MEEGYAKLKDILLLFIYLELGAMVSIYFKTHQLPVQFLDLYRYHRPLPASGDRRSKRYRASFISIYCSASLAPSCFSVLLP